MGKTGLTQGRANFIARFLISIVGVSLVMCGVALVTIAGLGTSPISVVIWVLTINGGLSFGGWTAVWNVLLVVIQLIILRGAFPKSAWLQVPALFVASVVLDFWMFLFSWIDPANYFQQLIVLLIGIFVLGVGVATSVIPKLLFMPGEGVVVAVATVSGWDFAKLKVINDVTIVVIGIIVSLILLGGIEGIREGTIIAAFLIGPVVRVVTPTIERIVAKLAPSE